MSGGPNNQQVDELRRAAARLEHLRLVEVQRLKVIETAQRELEECRREAHAKRNEVLELLNKMDVAANHNRGWEHRVVQFLILLVTRCEEGAL